MSSSPVLEAVRDAAFLSRLDHLARLRRRGGQERFHGSLLNRPGASGLDWHDAKPYEPGDDLRYLDWHLLLRLGRPYIRRLVSERSGRLDLLLDVSRSMSLGRPSKIDVGRALAFAAGYVALTAGDRVSCALFSEGLISVLGCGRSSGHRVRLYEFLRGAEIRGSTRMRLSLGAFADAASEVGDVLVISDLLDEDFEPGLAALTRRGFKVGVIRLRSHEDEEPTLPYGPARFVDVETGTHRTIVLSSDSASRYRELREQEAARTQGICAKARITLASIRNDPDVASLVFRDLHGSGLIA